MQTVHINTKVVAGLAHNWQIYLLQRQIYSPVKHPWLTIPAEIVNNKKLLIIFAEKLHHRLRLGSKYASVPYMTYLSKNLHQHQEDGRWTTS